MALEFEESTQDGQVIQAWLDDSSSPGWTGDWTKLRMRYSADGGETWQDLSMRLALISRILTIWRASSPHWPPTWVTAIGIANGVPWFEYKDEMYDWRTTFKPALWRAEFVPTHQHWRIRKLVLLNSDHEVPSEFASSHEQNQKSY
ncbi:hypothetical protein [Undibacterium curvum]|uniref:Uncharacterized protein n=1 Tax=Undibacterium curvum TaxID=2762294 RepID=A0ABR6ZZX9_9BURK|nr:hypothetical protein [Undibacterium curvum]MBC3930228.1 hypothetical protein [Undibacterium curvum]